MKVPFANLPRKVKGLLKGSKKGHRIRITPFATAQHHVIGTINPELTSITIDETSIAYVRVNREHLENEIFLDGNYSAIRVERHVSESAKRALDENLANNSKEIQKWKKAAKADKKFISEYAKLYPDREDVAETINWWIAIRCKPNTISKSNHKKILDGIPNRLRYLDEQNFDMFPLVCGNK